MEKTDTTTGAAVKILGIVGSLRKGSFNKALMRLALELVPDGAQTGSLRS